MRWWSAEQNGDERGAHWGDLPVKRCDIYDIAVEMVELSYIVEKGIDDPRELYEAMEIILDLKNRLFFASRLGGSIGPGPVYASGG